MKPGLKVFFGCATLILLLGVYKWMSTGEVVFRVDTEHSPTKYQAFPGWQIVVMSVILLGIGIYAYIKNKA